MFSEYLLFAHQLADAAGAVIRPYFGTALTVELKGDASPVSIADREAEAAMRALIAAHYPAHGIYGEEHGQQQTNQRYVWVIDPIDGTRAFLAGKKEWGTLIALCENGVPILGILDQPVTGERWVGMRGASTTVIATEDGLLHHYAPRNDSIIKSRPCASLAAASISTTSRDYFTPPQAKAFVTLARQCGEVIEDGDCYAYGLLAHGQRDIVVDAGLKPYDILALVPIIEGAGGIITAWDGAPVTLMHFDTAVAAATTELHTAIRALWASALA